MSKTQLKKSIEEIEAQETVQPEAKEQIHLVAYKHEFIDQLGNYLSTKPWAEVNGLLTELQKGQIVAV